MSKEMGSERNLELLKDKLSGVVGEDNVSFKLEDRLPYTRDLFSPIMSLFVGEAKLPLGVVSPAGAEQVQEVFRTINEFNSSFKDSAVSITPYTFGTNMSGATIPLVENSLILDLRRMNRILEINEESMTATIEPAVSFGRLDTEVRKKGLRCVSKIGGYTGSLIGNFASANVRPFNADWGWSDPVVNLEVVLPTGEILDTGSMGVTGAGGKNPYVRYVGPDIVGLYRGSYGAFGVITRAVVRLYPEGECTREVVAWFGELPPLMNVLRESQHNDLGRSVIAINNAEVTDISTSSEEKRDPQLIDHLMSTIPQWCLLIELSGNKEIVSAQTRLLESVIRSNSGECIVFEDGNQEEIGPPSFSTKVGDKWSDVVNSVHDYSTHRGRSAMRGIQFAPASFYVCVPLSLIPKFMETAKVASANAGAKDPALKDRPARIELIIIPYDRGVTYLGGCTLDYDPTDQEQVGNSLSFLMSLFQQISELGGVLPIMMSSFADAYSVTPILRKIKGVLDPNNTIESRIFSRRDQDNPG